MKALSENLVDLADTYAANRGVRTFRVGHLAAGRGGFFEALRKGGAVTTARYERVLDWFNINWPDDLPWPADIPRPARVRSEDAA